MRQEMMLRPRQAGKLRHLIEQRGVLELEVVNALDVLVRELVLHDERIELDQLQPADPGWMRAHLR